MMIRMVLVAVAAVATFTATASFSDASSRFWCATGFVVVVRGHWRPQRQQRRRRNPPELEPPQLLASRQGLPIGSSCATLSSATSTTERTTVSLAARRRGSGSIGGGNIMNLDEQQQQYVVGTSSGSGSWIERSMMENDDTADAARDDDGQDSDSGVVDTEAAVDYYDLGIDGVSLGTGPLSLRVYDAMLSRSLSSSLFGSNSGADDAEAVVALRQQLLLKECAMDFTAREAVRAVLKQNGLELAAANTAGSRQHEEAQSAEQQQQKSSSSSYANSRSRQDGGTSAAAPVWDSVDSIRIAAPSEEGHGDGNASSLYSSWEEAVMGAAERWEPGMTFSFVARRVPATMRDLTLNELLQALDPDGALRREAQASSTSGGGAPPPLLGDETLRAMASENARRCDLAPRDDSNDSDVVFAGLDTASYRVLHVSDLIARDTEQSTILHVMDALVSHGCLIVKLTQEQAGSLAAMWNATEVLFDYVENSVDFVLPKLATAPGVGSEHAKVGFATYYNGNLQFLETRQMRGTGKVLPVETEQVLGLEGCQALQDAFAIVADIGRRVTRIVVAASTEESGALPKDLASAAAAKLANELLDDGRALVSDDGIHSAEGSVSMSPHRLCRYSNNNSKNNDGVDDDDVKKQSATSAAREVFGAHTDSTFITAVPVAAVAGLEVLDEAVDRWYRPELAALRHYKMSHAARQDGTDADGVKTTATTDTDGIPWHSRYLIVMPGELLQLASREEVLATVHRVVATQSASRLSAPVLLRGRPGTRMDCDRYLGGAAHWPILQECDGMTIEDIHSAMQVQ
jgi:hypothetical protein